MSSYGFDQKMGEEYLENHDSINFINKIQKNANPKKIQPIIGLTHKS